MPRNTISPPQDAVRMFNKHILNPLMLLLAGRKYWYAAVIRHHGRCSGKEYSTPVVADRVSGGFLVPLPYGTDVDWLRNTQAVGGATITSGGQTYAVVGPTIVDASTAAELLSPGRQRVFQRFGIDHFARFALATDTSGRNHGQ